MHHRVVIDGDCCNLRVTDEVPRGAKGLEEVQGLPDMIGAGNHHLHRGLTQPRANMTGGLRRRHRIGEDTGMRCDAHKTEGNDVQESNRFGARQTGLPPGRRSGMKP